MRNEYRAIARVVKTHGRKGEVVTVPVHGLPSLMRKGLEVAVVPPPLKGPRVRSVASADDGDRGQLVRLDGVGDLDAASSLVGKTLLARVDDLPEGFEYHDADWLVGRAVVDEKIGPLGRIEEVMVGPANDVWSIMGPFGEVMIPVVDEFVLGTDDDGAIHVSVPDGLVDAEG